MKNAFWVIMASVLVFSVQVASADQCTDAQWQAAVSNTGDTFVSPVVETYDGVAIPVINLCVDGNVIRPISGAQITVSPTDTDTAFPSGPTTITWQLPLHGTMMVCSVPPGVDTCSDSDYVSRPVDRGQYNLSVNQGDVNGVWEVCTKTYTLPACK